MTVTNRKGAIRQLGVMATNLTHLRDWAMERDLYEVELCANRIPAHLQLLNEMGTWVFVTYGQVSASLLVGSAFNAMSELKNMVDNQAARKEVIQGAENALGAIRQLVEFIDPDGEYTDEGEPPDGTATGIPYTPDISPYGDL